MKRILILNGPNLNLLGKRQPEIYGTIPFEVFFEQLKKQFPQTQLEYFQSNHEGDLIDKLQQADGRFDAVIFNPAAYTHTSIALRDTVSAIEIPVVEVHISNIHEREDFRKISYIKDVVKFRVIGKGLAGYKEALEKILLEIEG